MTTKQMKNKKTKTVVHKPMVSEANPKTIYYFLLRIILFSFAIIAIVVLTDKGGILIPTTATITLVVNGTLTMNL